MDTTSSQQPLGQLIQQGLVWHGLRQTQPQGLLSSGHKILDQALAGGLPEQGLMLIHSDVGIGELRFLQGYLQRRCQQGLLVFIDPPIELCHEGLSSLGLATENCLLIKPKQGKDSLWAMEQCLQSGACDLVLWWENSQLMCHNKNGQRAQQAKLQIAQAKRLKLAAARGQAMALIFRSRQASQQNLPASLSINLNAKARGLELSITKRSHGWPINKLFIDLQTQWPQLCVPKRPNNITPLASQQRSLG